jgi:truncated hemoglobin YjbI
MSQDVMLGFFFDGRDLDSIADRQTGFLLKSAGLPTPLDSIRAPAKAHQNIPPILTGHFDRRIVLLKEVLAAYGLNSSQIERWIGFEESFRSQVVAATD